jgi:hypothetical protein
MWTPTKRRSAFPGFAKASVLKFTNSGELIWARALYSDTGSGSVALGGMVLDTSGNAYLGGGFLGSLGFSTGFGEGKTLVSCPGAEDCNETGFLAKVEPDGDLVWTHTFPQPPVPGGVVSTNAIQGVALNPAGNPAVVGIYAVHQGTGELANFVAEVDATSGNPIWSHTLGPAAFGADGIACDSAGNLYAVAQSVSLGSVSLDATGTFVEKLAPDASVVWTRALDAAAGGSPTTAESTALFGVAAQTCPNELLVLGSTTGAMAFEGTRNEPIVVSAPDGGSAIVVARLVP